MKNTKEYIIFFVHPFIALYKKNIIIFHLLFQNQLFVDNWF